ncbi:MAG: ABC transporter permease subunit [Candidatus Hydrogenedentes bacterium]|nr:ABC transporter permease subunit [Candidatus Hydrogenedentota bacterium]
MRKKTLIGFFILSILTIFGSSVLTAYVAPTSGTSTPSEIESKMIKDICLTTISIFGVLITIFISASVVPNEVENKVIYTVLSKPIRRFQYLLGKFIGVQLTVILNLVLMGILFCIAVYSKEGIFPSLLIWAILLTYCEFLVISAFTFAVSCSATSAVLPTIGGLFIYIIGNLTEYLKDVANRVGESTVLADKIVRETAYWLYMVLPNLQKFSLKNQVLYLSVNDPPKDAQIPQVIAYALACTVVGYIIALWVFRRKEL